MNKKIFLILFFSFIFYYSANAQCKEYIKAIAPTKLSPYILDGNFFAPVLYEGDKVELNRTFLANQKYKIAIIGMDFFAKKIIIEDEDGFIIFKNYPSKRNEKIRYYTDINGNKVPCFGSNSFEFELDRTQNLNIKVKLERKAKRRKNRLKGCMGIVIGFAQ